MQNATMSRSFVQALQPILEQGELEGRVSQPLFQPQ